MNYSSKIKLLILSHKLIAILITLVLSIGGYYIFSPSATTQASYVLGTVTRGNIISSIEGSGQVSSLNEVDIKSKVSGDITWVGVIAGQEVKNGQTLASIDSTDAQKTIAVAETSLAEAKLQYDKSLAQASIDYQKKLETLQNDKKDLETVYENVFNAISNAFLDLPTIITGVEDVLYGRGLSSGGGYYNTDVYKNFFGSDNANNTLVNSLVEIAVRDYGIARDNYDKNFLDFKDMTRYADEKTREDVLMQTIDTSKAMAQAAKSEQNILDTIVDIAQGSDRTISSSITTFQTKLKSYTGTINSDLSSLLSQQSSLENIKQQIINTQRDIELLLINNLTGNNPIDLQISKNSIAQKEANLIDLKADLANYTIRAPFDGTIAKVNIKKFDSISSGTSLSTIVTKQQLATVSLNEIDVAGIKVDQKVSLSFDAVEGLAMTGQVSEVDTIGTVSQGVVNYSVKIIFDTQDERVKSGMSVNASIITDTRIDVLTIPSSAIKSSGAVNYVEIPDLSEVVGQIGNGGMVLAKPLSKQQIEIGVTNGTSTEILSGLEEGDKIIIRTINGSSAQTASNTRQTNSIRVPGMGF